jgi:hypothetical protein
MTCSNPLDAAVLADYWLAQLPQSEEASVEEHLFACDTCGLRLRETIALAEGLAHLGRQGSLTMIVSEMLVQRARERGLQVREYAPPRFGGIACTVSAEDDFLIGRLSADLSEARRIDLSFCDARGMERLRFADIPFQGDAGGVMFQQSIVYAKAAPSETLIARLLAFDSEGAERLLGEYTFNHTRTIPGPGAPAENI